MMKIGKWIIVKEYEERSGDGHRLYDAKCEDCGWVLRKTKLWNIKKAAEVVGCNHPKKIWESRRLSGIYRAMISRCYNSEVKDYRFYGGKGIGVCEEWLSSKEEFINWANRSGYNDDLTIDRIDPKKNYCPENCQWIDGRVNAKIKSTTRLLTIDGKTDSISGWAKMFGIPKNTVVSGVRNKNDEEAINFIKRHIPA